MVTCSGYVLSSGKMKTSFTALTRNPRKKRKKRRRAKLSHQIRRKPIYH